MTTPEDISDDAALAAEYVLHLLDADDRKAFEARMLQDPDLRDLVRDWEADFAGMADEVPETAPPRSVKTALLKSVAPPAPARSRFGLWQTVFGGLLVAGLAGVLVVLGPQIWTSDPFTPEYQAEIASEDGSLVLVAAVNADASEIVIERTAGQPLEGRVLELWLIADANAAPVSLGVLGPGARSRFAVTETLAAALPTGTLAVSDEPPGGSPTGQPTGAVLATARMATL